MSDSVIPEFESEPFPEKVAKFLNRYHKGSLGYEACLECSSACCSHGGYAILENVLMIYDLYQKGHLSREDYEFPSALQFADFVRRYFDVYLFHTRGLLFDKQIAFFYMKSLSSDNHLISIPNLGWYHDARDAFFQSNPWMNKGCVFLNKKVSEWSDDDKDSGRHCILHTAEAYTDITAKPVGCVFHICTKPLNMKVPSQKECGEFDKLMASYYPNGVKRFLELTGESKKPEYRHYMRRAPSVLLAKLFAVASVLLWWLPFWGLFVSACALIVNRRNRGWMLALSFIAFILSLASTIIEITYY